MENKNSAFDYSSLEELFFKEMFLDILKNLGTKEQMRLIEAMGKNDQKYIKKFALSHTEAISKAMENYGISKQGRN